MLRIESGAHLTSIIRLVHMTGKPTQLNSMAWNSLEDRSQHYIL